MSLLKEQRDKAIEVATKANHDCREALRTASGLTDMLAAAEMKLAKVRQLCVNHRERVRRGESDQQSRIALANAILELERQAR